MKFKFKDFIHLLIITSLIVILNNGATFSWILWGVTCLIPLKKGGFAPNLKNEK